ncbi:hypothetical protein CACET_c24960 [Clostridium aceticum]|uniref:Uncharacterized protein n=1 Tax=Clostridium aceticum TaxID=84022 RepID=A0A0D8IAP6_9CLOT|nr:hypothetical protein [Clostridium aceticum]AKL95941.1 hypothetical protein CACET_c24960 [Clostridium aceticum]KJF27107.1 hypothetical protein TZ02_09945 [Clostridium aceticum]
MQTLMKISIVLLVFSFIMAIVLNGKKEKWKDDEAKIRRFTIFFINIPIGLTMTLLMYDATEHLRDFIYVIFIMALAIAIGDFIEKRYKKNEYFIIFKHLIFCTLLFLIVKHINKHLLRPIPYFAMLGPFIGVSLREVYEMGKRGSKKTLAAFLAICSGIAVFIITMNYLGEPMEGISKQERVVEAYLKIEEGYDEEIQEIRRIYNTPEDEGWRVFVSLKNPNRQGYIYYYRDNAVKKVEKLP